VLGGEVEQPRDAHTGVALLDLGCRRGERDGERGGDRVVAIAEVLVEDLPADFGAGDDVTDVSSSTWRSWASANAASRSRVRTRSARGSTLCVRAATRAA
jgi:hypothetical protein